MEKLKSVSKAADWLNIVSEFTEEESEDQPSQGSVFQGWQTEARHHTDNTNSIIERLDE